MMMNPASACGSQGATTRSSDSGAEPRGSNSSRTGGARHPRPRWRIFASTESPAMSGTPPTMMRLGSPSA